MKDRLILDHQLTPILRFYEVPVTQFPTLQSFVQSKKRFAYITWPAAECRIMNREDRTDMFDVEHDQRISCDEGMDFMDQINEA